MIIFTFSSSISFCRILSFWTICLLCESNLDSISCFASSTLQIISDLKGLFLLGKSCRHRKKETFEFQKTSTGHHSRGMIILFIHLNKTNIKKCTCPGDTKLTTHSLHMGKLYHILEAILWTEEHIFMTLNDLLPFTCSVRLLSITKHMQSR